MTIWPAYQHVEETTKGNLEVGKNADLIILDKNPLKVEPDTLKDLKSNKLSAEVKPLINAKALKRLKQHRII